MEFESTTGAKKYQDGASVFLFFDYFSAKDPFNDLCIVLGTILMVCSTLLAPFGHPFLNPLAVTLLEKAAKESNGTHIRAFT
jgi:hypothetical protein